MNERQLQAAILQLATLLGYRHYHTHDSRRSDPGWPDLVLLRPAARTANFYQPAKLVFAELKGPRGKLTREQAEWVACLEQVAADTMNVYVYVWRPEDWPDEIHTILSR